VFSDKFLLQPNLLKLETENELGGLTDTETPIRLEEVNRRDFEQLLKALLHRSAFVVLTMSWLILQANDTTEPMGSLLIYLMVLKDGHQFSSYPPRGGLMNCVKPLSPLSPHLWAHSIKSFSQENITSGTGCYLL